VSGLTPDQLHGRRGFGFLISEHHQACQTAFAAASRAVVQFVERNIFGIW
jgi:hypothetical protein